MSTKSNKTNNLEKQLDAAIDAGMVDVSGAAPAPKKRGRPSTKSVERPTTQPTVLLPEEKKIEAQKRVDKIIDDMKKRRLICQLRAFSAYFPEVTRESLNDMPLDLLTVEQLQKLYECFEESVLGASEISSIPIAIKKILSKTETTLVTIGANNMDHPVLGELIKMNGLGKRIEQDPEIDANVKLIAVKLAGRLPRNPYMNVITGIVRVAVDLYNESTSRRSVPDIENDPRYSKLTSNDNNKK